MSPTLKLEVAAISIIHIVAIMVSMVCFTIFFMKTRRDDPSANAFMVMLGSMILWMVFKIFKTVSPDITLRWVCILGYYACTCVLEVSFVEFGYATSKGRPLPVRVRRIIYTLPVMQFFWILTNPWHFLFYSHYDFFRDSFGPLFYAHMLLEYGFILTGLYFCRERFKREFAMKKRAITWLVSAAILIPLVLNFLFITKVLHAFTDIASIPVVFDITPIVFTWSTLLFMYATFNHDLFSLTPLMRHEITHHLNLPMALFDHRFRPSYANEAFQKLFHYTENQKTLLRQLAKHGRGAGEVGYEESVGSASYHIYCKEIRTLTRTQYIVTIRNISVYKTIQADIMAKQREIAGKSKETQATIDHLKQLSRENARTFVARELHDIIGHSLVTAIKLLEVVRIYGDQNTPALNNAVTALSSGLSGIKSIPKAHDAAAQLCGDDLKKAMDETIEQARHTGLTVSLNFQGMIYLLKPDLYTALHRTSTELITNCLKHADATRLFLSIKIQERDVHLMAVDNGRGTLELNEGNGLSGIRERAHDLGGTVQFSAEDGFMARLHLPVA